MIEILKSSPGIFEESIVFNDESLDGPLEVPPLTLWLSQDKMEWAKIIAPFMHSIKIPSFKPLNEDYFNELPRLQPAADSLVLDRFLEIKENLKSVIAVTIQSISFQETGLKDKVLDFINSFKHLELLLFLSCDLFNEDIAAIGKSYLNHQD